MITNMDIIGSIRKTILTHLPLSFLFVVTANEIEIVRSELGD